MRSEKTQFDSASFCVTRWLNELYLLYQCYQRCRRNVVNWRRVDAENSFLQLQWQRRTKRGRRWWWREQKLSLLISWSFLLLFLLLLPFRFSSAHTRSRSLALAIFLFPLTCFFYKLSTFLVIKYGSKCLLPYSSLSSSSSSLGYSTSL